MTGKLTVVGMAVAAVVLFSPPIAAQDQPGRYTMKDIEDGMLRLDTQTGDVSYCSRRNESWVCETAEDDRSAFADEVARLQRENAELKTRVAELENDGGEMDKPELKLPSDADMEKVMSFMERLMRRFYAFAKTLRDQLEEDQYGEET